MSIATILVIESSNSEATEQLGALLGKRLKGGEVIELISDLGGGKTTLVRGLARGFGSGDKVASPTFTISKVYKSNKPYKAELKHLDAPLGDGAEGKGAVHDSTRSAHRKPSTTRSAKTASRVTSSASEQADGVLELWHFDFYRLRKPGLMEHELADAIGDPKRIVAIEWAEHVQHVLPDERLKVEIKTKGENLREFLLTFPTSLEYLIKDLR